MKTTNTDRSPAPPAPLPTPTRQSDSGATWGNGTRIIALLQVKIAQLCREDECLLIYNYQPLVLDGLLLYIDLSLVVKPLSDLDNTSDNTGRPMQLVIDGNSGDVINISKAMLTMGLMTEEELKEQELDPPIVYGNYHQYPSLTCFVAVVIPIDYSSSSSSNTNTNSKTNLKINPPMTRADFERVFEGECDHCEEFERGVPFDAMTECRAYLDAIPSEQDSDSDECDSSNSTCDYNNNIVTNTNGSSPRRFGKRGSSCDMDIAAAAKRMKSVSTSIKNNSTKKRRRKKVLKCIVELARPKEDYQRLVKIGFGREIIKMMSYHTIKENKNGNNNTNNNNEEIIQVNRNEIARLKEDKVEDEVARLKDAFEKDD